MTDILHCVRQHQNLMSSVRHFTFLHEKGRSYDKERKDRKFCKGMKLFLKNS